MECKSPRMLWMDGASEAALKKGREATRKINASSSQVQIVNFQSFLF